MIRDKHTNAWCLVPYAFYLSALLIKPESEKIVESINYPEEPFIVCWLSISVAAHVGVELSRCAAAIPCLGRFSRRKVCVVRKFFKDPSLDNYHLSLTHRAPFFFLSLLPLLFEQIIRIVSDSLIVYNKKVLLNVLFASVKQTLTLFSKDPKYGLVGKLGFTSVLHTWDQKMNLHYHLHCIIPAGVYQPENSAWIPAKYKFLFPVKALSKVFRGKFVSRVRKAYENGTLKFSGQVAKPDFAI